MLDSFGFWWTWVNEIQNLSSFLQGGLNAGVRFDVVFSVFSKFHVPGPMGI